MSDIGPVGKPKKCIIINVRFAFKYLVILCFGLRLLLVVSFKSYIMSDLHNV